MSLRQTHTYAVLEVSRLAFDEIAKKLREAEYDHAFHDDVIDMHGIALAPEAPVVLCASPAARQDGLKLFSWLRVESLRRVRDGSVFVMARTREEAVKLAVDAARNDGTFKIEEDDGEHMRIIEFWDELLAKAPNVGDVPKAFLIRGSE